MLSLLAVAALLAACGGDEGVELREDRQLEAELRQLRQAGEAAPLRQFVPGDWDHVYSFAEPVTREFVVEQVGRPVDMGDTFTGPGNMLVFTKSGDVQDAVSVEVNLFDGSYGPGVRVIADPPNTGRLQLNDGSGSRW
ncbi:hypothetical protein FB471_3997 [Amycolatopsis cihanbeyliensis]|uniref:Uncharacterized protein n=1 Tax=Amycolatopsis cihanbeyliensis TaxID=1128664 RepID=A0A542DML3_AMYCI|nr:hypothetical protein FB471_3997 [Amycolatopsis cihanbeyliensis]